VNVTNIHTVYNTTVINRGVENRISYNGGNGGIAARPTPAQEAFDRERHLAPIAAQNEHIQQARGNPALRAETNHGKPPIAATDRPGSFSGHGVVPAREAGAPYRAPDNARENHPATNAGENRPANPTHASELPQHQVVTPPSTGDAKLDRKYQQQQEKLVAKQNQEHQKLQQQQEKEDQRAQQQVARQQNQARQQQYQVRQQQTEQRHQQQTQQMEMRHTQQTQSFQERAVRPAGRPR
jgi:hypothetical protein